MAIFPAYRHRKPLLIAILFMLMLSAIVSCTKENTTLANDERYFPKVRGIIQAQCLECHTPGGQGLPTILTNDTTIAFLAGAIKAATIDPPTPRNKRMPQGGELSAADKAIILAWFERGGKITD